MICQSGTTSLSGVCESRNADITGLIEIELSATVWVNLVWLGCKGKYPVKAIWLGLGSLVSLVGLLLVVLCLWFEDMDFVPEATTLIVAGLGFLAAVVGLTTWVEERQRVREDKA